MNSIVTPSVPMVARALRRSMLALLSLWAVHASAQVQLPSTRLADVVQSNGNGVVNLMVGTGNTPISAASLEAYRQAHLDASTGVLRHFLALGVDVNENNKGMEQSSAQGVTLATVELSVTRPSGTTVYRDFRTRTRALVAPQGSRTRAYYYTALGEAGSSRITAANAVQSAFDSTLDVFVPDSLDDATAVMLRVTLLDVNKSLGDPESFYDYSGGFEDLALLNREDAYYLNVTVAQTSSFRDLAPAAEETPNLVTNDSLSVTTSSTTPASWSHFPSANGWYFVAYEDNYPQQGDYDFNDAVVAYRYRLGLDLLGRVVRVESEAYLVAEGAWFTVDWSLRIPVVGNGVAQCLLRLPTATTTSDCATTLQGGTWSATPFAGVDNSGALFTSPQGWSANTVRGSTTKQGAYASMSLRLDVAIDQEAVGSADPRLYVHDTGRWIDLASRDGRGFPYALRLPSGWRNPYENVDMGIAYPRFRVFVESGGTQELTWYLSPDQSQVFDLGAWQWGP